MLNLSRKIKLQWQCSSCFGGSRGQGRGQGRQERVQFLLHKGYVKLLPYHHSFSTFAWVTLPGCPSTVVISAKIRMADAARRSLRIQQLSQFALSDSLRDSVANSIRKRSKSKDNSAKRSLPADSGEGDDGETENAAKKRNSKARGVVMNLSSRKAIRAVKVDKSARCVKPERLGRLPATTLAVENSQASVNEIHEGEYKRLDASFYECDALELAPKLLGKLLRRDDVILQITEVEAYRPGDSACHGRVGQTARTAPLFGPAGHAYVYLCYGLHMMLNVVADSVGVGAAVLIRACSPVAGLDVIWRRRGQITEKPILLTGPGKVGQALGLTTEWSTHPLYTSGGLEILDAPTPANMLIGPRVGINYAEPKDVSALWRFAIADSAWISPPRATLRLAPTTVVAAIRQGIETC